MAIGKVGKNGTLNENGAFYSVQDVNKLLENSGGGGGDLPTPTVADSGKAVVVNEEGKYALGEAGGGGSPLNRTISVTFTDSNQRGQGYSVNLFGCTLDEDGLYKVLNSFDVGFDAPKTIRLLATDDGASIKIDKMLFQNISLNDPPTVSGGASLNVNTGSIDITDTCTITIASGLVN